MSVTKPNLVSLFSGGGGLDLGLEAAGFNTVFAADIDYHSCQTLSNGKVNSKLNGKDFLANAKIKQIDICELTADIIFEETGLQIGEVDLLAGGPPCQAFSIFGKRLGTNDPRGLLPYEYLRVLRDVRPKSFIFENVFGLLTINNGETFRELCEMLEKPAEDLNYKISIFRLNSADYGVPQYRDRVFIIGSQDGIVINEIPPLCSGISDAGIFNKNVYFRHRNVADAFRGLPSVGKLPNHTGRVHSDRIIERYKNLKFGERDSKTRINKLNPEKPSFTIIVGSDKGGGKGHVHPYEPREVTPRESARIQTFPDWWAFSGTSRHPIRQVGNAVPPLLAAIIGRELMQKFFFAERKSLIEILDSLDQSHLFEEDVNGI